MKDGERERPIENYGKKEQKEWLDNILPDPHPCTAGNKEEEHTADVFHHMCKGVLFSYSEKFAEVLQKQQNERIERNRERMRMMTANPFDPDVQKKIAEEIR